MIHSFTTGQLERLEIDFKRYANQDIKIEAINDTVYCYGSELAVLRISMFYLSAMDNATARVSYSKNLHTWFFALDVSNK